MTHMASISIRDARSAVTPSECATGTFPVTDPPGGRAAHAVRSDARRAVDTASSSTGRHARAGSPADGCAGGIVRPGMRDGGRTFASDPQREVARWRAATRPSAGTSCSSDARISVGRRHLVRRRSEPRDARRVLAWSELRPRRAASRRAAHRARRSPRRRALRRLPQARPPRPGRLVALLVLGSTTLQALAAGSVHVATLRTRAPFAVHAAEPGRGLVRLLAVGVRPGTPAGLRRSPALLHWDLTRAISCAYSNPVAASVMGR